MRYTAHGSSFLMAPAMLPKLVIGLMLACAAVTVAPAASAECYPNEGPCGLQQPPNCGPVTPVDAYASCQVGALSNPCVDGCGFIAYATGNALWACGVVLHAVTGEYCA
jgi:hypothetical protein